MAYLNRNILSMLFIGLFLVQAYSTPYKDLNIDFLLEDSTKSIEKKHTRSKNKGKKSFSSVIKGLEKIDGLFTIYWNRGNNQAYISILPDQLEKIYLAGLTRQSGDGYYLDGSSMLNEYPFMFKQVGERIQFINANVKFRADKESPFHRSVKRHSSYSILSS